MLLTRDAYDIDIPAIIDAAAATGTIIELNGSPRRLDMMPLRADCFSMRP